MFISILIPPSIPFSTNTPTVSSSSSHPKPRNIKERSEQQGTNQKKKKYEFHIAPMQCYTNLSLRKMFNMLSPNSILWTEMEKVNDILESDEDSSSTLEQSLRHAWSKRLGSPQDDDHSNLILQLGCNNPLELKSCLTRTLSDYDTLKGINLNCGCPSIESGGATHYGASLMKDSELTGRLVHCMKEAVHDVNGNNNMEVSVKCRAAVFENVDEMRPFAESDYTYLSNYVSTISDAGANHVIIHARPAILSGLSPVKNRIIPELNYDFVEQIASDFPHMRVTLNGGIVGLDCLNQMVKKTETNNVSSHMAGRWCLRRPLDLAYIESRILEDANGSLPSVVTALEEYIHFALTELSIPPRQQKITTDELCLPLYLVFEQLKEDFNYEEDGDVGACQPLLSHDEIDNALDVLSSGIVDIQSCVRGSSKNRSGGAADLSFNQMTKCFQSVVGKKVINKWRRNRAEL